MPRTIKNQRQALKALEGIVAENEAAAKRLQGICKDDARWQKLQRQAALQGVTPEHFTGLCGRMVRTRSEWQHLTTDEQRGLAAFIGLLCALGSPVEAESEQLTKLLS